MAENEAEVEHWVARYPPADITPDEFEQFVADVLRARAPGLVDFAVTPHETIEGVDGTLRLRCDRSLPMPWHGLSRRHRSDAPLELD